VFTEEFNFFGACLPPKQARARVIEHAEQQPGPEAILLGAAYHR
jgi:hypothetical protein